MGVQAVIITGICDWHVVCNTREPKKALRVAKHLSERLGLIPFCQSHEFDIDSDSIAVHYRSQLAAQSWSEMVYALLAMAGRCSKDLRVHGSIDKQFTVTATHVQVPGIELFEANVDRPQPLDRQS